MACFSEGQRIELYSNVKRSRIRWNIIRLWKVFYFNLNFNKPLVNWKRLLIKIRIHVCLTKYFGYYVYFRSFFIRKMRLKNKSLLKVNLKKSKYFNVVKKSSESYSSPYKLQQFEITELQLPHLWDMKIEIQWGTL
jgi:hypothetical protein